MIELTEFATEETRLDLFDRLNSGGTRLTPMEILRGTLSGPLINLVTRCSEHPLLIEMCPIAASKRKRFEYEERVLRFFAYSCNYSEFDHRVDEFLQNFAKKNCNIKPDTATHMEEELLQSLQYVHENFPIGFRRNPNDNNIPRVRFEAILVGTALALRTKKTMYPQLIPTWIDGDMFKFLTKSDASNNRDKVLDRFEYVCAMLLKESFISNNKRRRK